MDKNLVIVTDKDLAIFLVMCGLDIIDIRKDKGHNRSLIFFHDNEELKKATLEYANKSKVVNVADYLAAEKRIKTLLYLQKQ
ncbi:hypothetical protein FDF74_04570 [Clostridium niameyense]|uniref:DUF5659 domain-containing protein n=1 Tax=Clostridium niameyense TaxID=1622073 RepID=A0A6M0RA64_9CLOT|nr:DUF5659 domain-containing protein [Clostridium niameyense]NEZ46489.1 hypothetical protein [Clostridium niameyense]